MKISSDNDPSTNNILCLDTSNVFLQSLSNIKKQSKLQRTNANSKKMCNSKTVLTSDQIISRNDENPSLVDLYQYKNKETNSDAQSKSHKTVFSNDDNDAVNCYDTDSSSVNTILLNSNKEYKKTTNLDDDFDILVNNQKLDKNQDKKGHIKQQSLRKRGRPKNSDHNKRDVIVETSAANPLYNKNVLTNDDDTDTEEKHNSTCNERKGRDNDKQTRGVGWEDKEKVKLDISVKDPRIITRSDTIKSYPDFYNIDDISIDTFKKLREYPKATFCFKDPYSVCMGMSQKNFIRIESEDHHIDRWPYCNDLSSPHLLESSLYKYTKPSHPLYKHIYETSHQTDLSKECSDLLNRHHSEVVQDNEFLRSRNTSVIDATKGNQVNLPNDSKITSKDDKKNVSNSKISETQKVGPNKKGRKKKLKPEDTKSNNDVSIDSNSTTVPIFDINSNSHKMIEMTTSIVDDQEFNPAFYGHTAMNKHKRGVHDNRYSRLFTMFENPETFFPHLDKYHIKERKERFELKKDNIPNYTTDKFIRRITNRLSSVGVNEETTNAGIDHIEYVLGKSNTSFMGIHQRDYMKNVKDHVKQYMAITKGETLRDPSNYIKRFVSNFSIIYHPMLVQKDGVLSAFLPKPKTPHIIAYSMCDFFSERYQDVSYVNGDECLLQEERPTDDHTQEKDNVFVEQKEKKTNFQYLNENALLRINFFLRYVSLTSLQDRILMKKRRHQEKGGTSYPKTKKKDDFDEDQTGNENDSNKNHDDSLAKSTKGNKQSKDGKSEQKKRKWTNDDKPKGRNAKRARINENGGFNETKRDKSKVNDKKGNLSACLDINKLDTNSSNKTSYQNRLPIHQFFVDNPIEKTSASLSLAKSLIFDIVSKTTESIPEIIMFINSESHFKNHDSNKHSDDDDNDDNDDGNDRHSSDKMNVDSDDNSKSKKDHNINYNSSKWVVSSQLKYFIDRQKDCQRLWYPPRRLSSYPPPLRKTYNTGKVTFYVSRMKETEVTFCDDRPEIISGKLVRNEISALSNYQPMSYRKRENDLSEIVSPFVPRINEILYKETSNETINDSNSSKKTTSHLRKSSRDKVYYQDISSYISNGPIGNAIKQSLKKGVHSIVKDYLDELNLKGGGGGISKDMSSDSMLVSDGYNIGLVHLKSWENLGSFRLHSKANYDIPVVTKSYHESFMRPVGPGERPCIRGQSCICNISKARQDILEAKNQRSQVFIGTEFLLPNEYTKFRCAGILPDNHGTCIICNIFTVNVLVNAFMRNGFEPSEPIQNHGVLVDSEDGYDISSCLPYTYGPSSNFTGLIAPFPIYREQDLIYVVIKSENCEIKRIKMNNTQSHFHMASITNLKQGLTQQQQQQQKQQQEQNQTKKNEKNGVESTNTKTLKDILRENTQKILQSLHDQLAH